MKCQPLLFKLKIWKPVVLGQKDAFSRVWKLLYDEVYVKKVNLICTQVLNSDKKKFTPLSPPPPKQKPTKQED